MGVFHSVSKWLCGKQQFLDPYFLHHQQILIHKIANLYLVPRKYIISPGFLKYPVIWNLACFSLTCRAHSNGYGLVTPYSHRNSNQHWLEYSYLLCNRCQSIIWINADLFFYEQKQTKISCTQWWLFFRPQYVDSKLHQYLNGILLVLSIPRQQSPRGPPGSCRPEMGPMLAPWTLLSG